jgi:acyl-CoA reductase-like NAD-dependent aldehyde dehydrogenase
MSERLEVRKTYKLYVGGSFPRSESGRSYEVRDARGAFLANAVRASRKDVRDAVAAARKASERWAGATGYNRGQILYRIAEMMETRRTDLQREVDAAEGGRAREQVDEAIDTFVYYAGWTDKIAQVAGNLNPVAGPYFNISAPEPTGIVGIVAPEAPSLVGLAERLAPVMCGGNTAVVLASEKHPLPAIAFAECLATADVPDGVVNILTGMKAELVPVLAGHLDVDALDVTGIPDELREDAERTAAENVKRLAASKGRPSPYEVTAFTETKTVWHPKGA